MSTATGTLTAPVHAVLFDLDGTLVDTAPDMVAALWRLQDEENEPRIDYELARAYVSNGSLGLLGLAWPDLVPPRQGELQRRFLQHYLRCVAADSTVFPGLHELLDELDARDVPWGVVTNKPQAFTEPLLTALGLHRRARCAISGDTLPQRKPDPAPMLLASRMLAVDPAHTVYVGDAARDIEAGRAAGMPTVAALWGYITDDDDPVRWQADAIAATPAELCQLLLKGVR